MKGRLVGLWLQLLGAAAVAVGAGLVFWPAGVIVAGVLLVALGVAVEVPEDVRPPDPPPPL